METTSAVTELTTWEDEELIAWDRRRCCATGAAELERRHRSWLDGYVEQLCRRCGVPEGEWEDARQEGVRALLDAVKCFKLSQVDRPGSCRFRSFLGLVVRRRTLNFARRYWREKRHYARSRAIDGAWLMKGCEETDDDKEDWPASLIDFQSPLVQAKAHELQERLEAAFKETECAVRELCEFLARGHSLTASAREMGISRGKARELLKIFKKLLRGHWET